MLAYFAPTLESKTRALASMAPIPVPCAAEPHDYTTGGNAAYESVSLASLDVRSDFD